MFGLLLAFGALLLRLQQHRVRRAAAAPAPVAGVVSCRSFAHLGLVLIAGVYLPPALVAWFQHVAAARMT